MQKCASGDLKNANVDDAEAGPFPNGAVTAHIVVQQTLGLNNHCNIPTSRDTRCRNNETVVYRRTRYEPIASWIDNLFEKNVCSIVYGRRTTA